MNIIKQIGRHTVLSAFLLLVTAGVSLSAQAGDEMITASGVAASAPKAEEMITASGVAKAVPKKDVYVLVNGTPITYAEYNAELIGLLKQRYYHGQVPAAKAEGLRKELTDTMVDRVLEVQDADRRGIKPDEEKVQQVIAMWEKRGKLNGKYRDKLIGEIRDVEGKSSQLEQLKKMLRDVPPPTPEEVRAYFDKHPDQFTEPEKMRLSVILVPVDASSPVSVWTEAYSKAQRIYDQLKDGSTSDFAAMARKVSGDKSAANGGDLGYLHHGMLPRGLEDKVDSFKVGEVVGPIKMLEGMAVFRLEDRISSRVHTFDEKKELARLLLVRDMQEHAEQDNIDRLHKAAKIEIFNKTAY